MAAQHKVEDLASGADRIKVILAILIVLAGVVSVFLTGPQLVQPFIS